MKTFIAISIIIAQLISSVGFKVDIHECGSNKSFSLFGFSLGHDCCCDHDSKNHKDSCCKDTTSIIKADTKDKFFNTVQLSLYNSYLIINQIDLERNFDLRILSDLVYSKTNEDPPDCANKLFLLYSEFLI
jgi:hypothetical protein